MSAIATRWAAIVIAAGTLCACAEREANVVRDASSLTTLAHPLDPDADRSAIARRFSARLTETPFLRMRVIERVGGDQEYTEVAIMSANQVRQEVFRKGETRPFLARYSDRRRTQEFVPLFKFQYGSESQAVVLEYDYAPDGWSKMINPGVACEVATLSYSWFWRDKAAPDMIPRVILRAQTADIRECLGRRCYHYHDVVEPFTDEKGQVFWAENEGYIDAETFDPVRWSRSQIHGANREQVITRTSDFQVEHLATDEGLKWRLDASQFSAD